MVIATNIPAGEKVSNDFQIRINGNKVEAYQIRVSAIPFCHTFWGTERTLDQTELAAVVSFSADEPVNVELIPNRQFKKITIRPLSEKIVADSDGEKISFTINHPGQYVVELDGPHNALHLFADPVKDYGVLPDAENTLYFDAGIHRIGQVVLEDNTTVYIDRDAVVYGSFLAYGAENIRILGNGVLCGSWYDRQPDDMLLAYDIPRVPDSCYESPGQRKAFLERMAPVKTSICNKETYIPGTGTKLFKDREQFKKFLEIVHPVKAGLHFYHCRNIEVNGIIMRDATGLSNTIAACEYVNYDNVKTIGMWRYNTDGIDFYNSRNCMVRNTFIRAFDDGICMKGQLGYDTFNTENILVENCVLWNDWGKALELGVDTIAPEISHITYRDCDIIHHAGVVMDIGNEDRADIHDVLFEDIRVEYSVHDLKPYHQKTDNEKYVPQRWVDPLIFVGIDCNLWSSDNIPGKNHHITFRNIEVFTEDDMPFPPVIISGKDEEHTSSDFVFENIMFNGKRITNKTELNLQLGDYVEETALTLL